MFVRFKVQNFFHSSTHAIAGRIESWSYFSDRKVRVWVNAALHCFLQFPLYWRHILALLIYNGSKLYEIVMHFWKPLNDLPKPWLIKNLKWLDENLHLPGQCLYGSRRWKEKGCPSLGTPTKPFLRVLRSRYSEPVWRKRRLFGVQNEAVNMKTG